MEADFKFANKQIFGVRMLGAVRLTSLAIDSTSSYWFPELAGIS